MKSHNKLYLELAASLVTDLAAMCSARGSQRDIRTITSRLKHEGVSFLTLTLPSFGKDLETCLAAGIIVPGLFRNFKKRLMAPAFLRGFIEQVFDTEKGGLLDEPNIVAVYALRQISFYFKKVKMPCAHSRVKEALSEFTKIEHELDTGTFVHASDTIFDFVASTVWPSIFRGYNAYETVPKHGPGATVERLSGNRKFVQEHWYERLEEDFPLTQNIVANEAAVCDGFLESVKLVSEESELPVRVITVPKTLSSPRIIAIEPVCMQYTQQGVSRFIVDSIESHELTSGHINFSDQEVNRKLALMSSRDGSMATLDLSSASDRVPLIMVERMLAYCPDLLRSVLACRSRRAQLPNGEVLNLRKFASMGSALCFPVEAMYFYTICVVAFIVGRNLPHTVGSLRHAASRIFIYGDDIIVPTDVADIVADHLQEYHCKVNTAKSFSTGKFRESCGMDAYDGQEVTPIYLRMPPPSNKRSGSALVSWVATARALVNAGLWQTASVLFKRVESILGVLPNLPDDTAGLGRNGELMDEPSRDTWHVKSVRTRFNVQLQRREVRTWVASPVYVEDTITGHSALLKCLLSLESRKLSPLSTYSPGDSPDYLEDLASGCVKGLPEVDKEHLSRSARHGVVTLKRRWVPES